MRRWSWAVRLLMLGLVSFGTISNWADDAAPVISEAVRQIHRDAILIDGHNDLPWELRNKSQSDFVLRDLAKPQPGLHTDIQRLRASNLTVQFWSAWVPTDTIKEKTSLKTTLEQIDLVHRMVRRYPETFEMAGTVDDIMRIRKSGKIASLIGIEGGHSIENSLSVLRVLYSLGARYMTLTHSESLDWADSATDKSKCGGLSPFGEQVVLEMNRLGMMVDISHVSPECMQKVLNLTKAPVIFSHSSARALADHPRNVPDDILKQLKEKDGVVMINFFPAFIMPDAARSMREMFQVDRKLKEQYPKEADYKQALEEWKKAHPVERGSVKNVADHIDHVRKMAGVERIGLGSDFDGISSTPRFLEDVSQYPNLTQELMNRGYTAEELKLILGGNLLRVMRKTEEVAKSMANVNPK